MIHIFASPSSSVGFRIENGMDSCDGRDGVEVEDARVECKASANDGEQTCNKTNDFISC